MSGRAKSIHKATVGKRCLHKERKKGHLQILFHAPVCEVIYSVANHTDMKIHPSKWEWMFSSEGWIPDSRFVLAWLSHSSKSHQRSFKVRCGRRRPGGRYDAVDWVLLLGVDVLHVEWRAVLGLALGLLSVQAAVHATVAILRKECVDGLYPGLSAWKIGKRAKSEITKNNYTNGPFRNDKGVFKVNSPWWVFPEMFLLPLSSTCMPTGA